MTKFLKVIKWEKREYGGIDYRRAGKLRFINIDTIDNFYKLLQ